MHEAGQAQDSGPGRPPGWALIALTVLGLLTVLLGIVPVHPQDVLGLLRGR